jgi:hypothetical protein
MDFAKARFVVGEIAEAEGGGDKVEGLVGEEEAQDVGFGEKQIPFARALGGAEVLASQKTPRATRKNSR